MQLSCLSIRGLGGLPAVHKGIPITDKRTVKAIFTLEVFLFTVNCPQILALPVGWYFPLLTGMTLILFSRGSVCVCTHAP
jgi:hypothetical protein